MRTNRLTAAVRERRAHGAALHTLISSNFHDNGFFFPRGLLRDALASYADRQHYRPDPKGDTACRAAIAEYYRENDVHVDPEQLLVTASTSDAYNLVFSAETAPGDRILLPTPGYPLFEHIAAFHKLEPRFYTMRFADRFSPDPETIAAAVDERTRFVVLISPNNPTGRIYSEEELKPILEICRRHDIALICDEVFSEYIHDDTPQERPAPQGGREVSAPVHRVPRPAALAPDLSVLTFNGISKLLALPDLKLGWILVSGPTDGGRRREIAERLELANDMFLNAGGPAQHVTTALLPEREHYLGDARRRIAAARRALISAVAEVPGLELLPPEGGIHAVLRLPSGLSTTDEEFAVTLVREYGIELHPGYLYGMDDDRSLVLSLLPGETALTGGMAAVRDLLRRR